MEVLYRHGDYALVKRVCGEVTNYIVAYKYDDETKSWGNGTYFTLFGGENELEQLHLYMTALSEYLHKVGGFRSYNKMVRELDERTICYERMSEIASKAIDGLVEDGDVEAAIYLRDEIELDEEEAKYFGVHELMYEEEDEYEV